MHSLLHIVLLFLSAVLATNDGFVKPSKELKKSAEKLLTDALKIPYVNPYVLKASRDVEVIAGNVPIDASSLQYTLDELSWALRTYGKGSEYDVIREDGNQVATFSGLNFSTTPTQPSTTMPAQSSSLNPEPSSSIPNTSNPPRPTDTTVPVTSQATNSQVTETVPITSSPSETTSATESSVPTSTSSVNDETSGPTGLPFQPTSTDKNSAISFREPLVMVATILAFFCLVN